MFAAPLLLVVLARAQAPAPAPAAGPEAQGIEDNSFLVEEAYNQDKGVVQHISNFSKERHGDWAFTFTQEWPVNPAPRHQLSYTVSALSADGASGVGDVWLNWRYQVRDSARVAIAPRVSVSLPTGDARAGRGTGGAGLQAALPISIRSGAHLALHSNASVTLVPHAEDAAGDRAPTSGFLLAESAVWLARPRFNGFCEVVFTRQEDVLGASATEWGTSAVVNPGVRWAYNLAGGAQVVPGVSIPVDLQAARGERLSVFAYFSVEHPFGKRP